MALTGTTPTPPSQTDPNRLGCGRSIDDVWVRVDLPPDPHEQTCPDCQAARHDLGDLAAATRGVVAADKADPALRLKLGGDNRHPRDRPHRSPPRPPNPDGTAPTRRGRGRADGQRADPRQPHLTHQ